MLWALFFPIVPVMCHSPAEFLWRTHLSLACGFIYFYYFLFPMRSLTFDRTPINDAHELHPRAETSCACQRCYFCKQFEGTASYGRIRVSCAHSLIRKVRVYRECVSVCACTCVCTSKPSAVMWPSWGSVLWKRARGHSTCCAHCPQGCFYSGCALTFLLFKGQMMGAIVSDAFNNN